MSETMRNILINYLVMEILVTIDYSIIICGLFQANKKQRQGVFALYLFEMSVG
ncbi:MAG: hypothetical protein ACOX1S_03835 [Anaerostipes sp.]|jgi:hypothetical protein